MRPGLLRDGLRLSFGTLSVLPVPAPQQVDRAAAGVAMAVSVLPGALLGAAAGLVLVALASLGVPLLVSAVGAVATSTLLNRFLHLDGLADTADGLVASMDREKALAVMRRGDVGPAGAAVLVLVLLAQVSALAAIASAVTANGPGRGVTVVGLVVLAWAASRAVLPVVTARGARAARGSGLGATVLGTVPVPVAVAVPVALAAVGGLTVGPTAALAVGVAVLAAGALAAHAHRRLGGLTGDVLGGCVEVSLLAALTVLATA